MKSLIKDTILEYLKTRIDFLKINWLEKIAKVITVIITSVIVFYTFSFFLLCTAFLFSYWYMERNDKGFYGFIISAGFFFILALFFYVLRKPIFSNSFVKYFQTILFPNNENDDER